MFPQTTFVNAPANLMTSETVSIKYLIGILNSNIFNYDFKSKGISLGDAFEWKKQYIETVNLPTLDTTHKQELARQIEALVEQILVMKSNKTPRQPLVDTPQEGNFPVDDISQNGNIPVDTSELEAQIDQLVYQLYDLTADEIAVID